MKYLDHYKIFENVAQAKSILKSLDIPETDSIYLKIRDLLKGHEGYIGWFTKLHYIKKYKWNELLELWDFINDNKASIGKVGNIITYDNIEKLQDDIESIKLKSGLMKIIGEFPQKQKSLLRESDNEMLIALSKRRDSKGFFKKVASYHNRKDLVEALKNFIKTDPSASIDNVIRIAKSKGSEIVHVSYEDQLLIVRVFTVGELNAIAGDCSWCIRNPGTFDAYVNGGNMQYIMFFFDRTDNLSRIGATWTLNPRFMRNNSSNFLYTAHNKVDGHIVYDTLSNILSEYNFKIENLNYKLSDINANDVSIKQLMDIFNLSKEEIVKIKSKFKAADLELFSKDEIEKWELLDKSEIGVNTLDKYTFDEIKDKGMLYRVDILYISTINNLYVKYGIRVIDYLKSNLDIFKNLASSSEYKSLSNVEFYRVLSKSDVPRLGDLAFGNRWSETSAYSSTYSLFRALWFHKEVKENFDKACRNELSYTSYDRKHAIGDVIKGLEMNIGSITFMLSELGITTQDILNSSKDESTYRHIISYCEDNSKDVENIKKMFFDFLMNSKIESRSMSIYSKIFTDERYKELEDKVFKQDMARELSSMKPYDRGSNKLNSEQFFNKYGKFIEENNPSFGESDSNLILAYARIGKLDDLKISFVGRSGGKTVLNTINSVICGQFATNGGLREKLTEEQNKYIYNWLKKQDLSKVNITKYQGRDGQVHEFNEGDPRQNYSTSIYLYDKKEFKKYMDWVSVQRNNERSDNGYSMTGKLPDRTDKKMFTTMRPSLLRSDDWYNVDLFIVLKDRPDEILSIVNEMISWKLFTPELMYIFRWISHLRTIQNKAGIMTVIVDELKRRNASGKTIADCEKYIREIR